MSAITTEERRTHILALKAEGLTYRQIAERIGLSPIHVGRIASPRAYEANQLRSQEAKRRRRGVCVDCGAETRYAGKANVVSIRCHPCGARALGVSKRGTGTTQQRVLAYIGDGERRFTEIVNACGMSHGMGCSLLHRMRKHGLLERPRRGVYRKASA